MNYHYTLTVTLLALLLYAGVSYNVARARALYKVKAPAVTGNESFERCYRVQMNTLEQLAFFLPSMWLYAIVLNDVGAAVGGLVWIGGRLIYSVSYLRDPSTRTAGFTIALVAAVGLFLGAAYGVIRSWA